MSGVLQLFPEAWEVETWVFISVIFSFTPFCSGGDRTQAAVCWPTVQLRQREHQALSNVLNILIS